MWNAQRSEGLTIRSALDGLKRFKESWISVICLKGSISLGQVITLIVLLSLASSLHSPLYLDRPQSAPSEACSHSQRYQAWMGVQIARLLMCWANSLWMCLRRRRRDMACTGRDERTETSSEGDRGNTSVTSVPPETQSNTQEISIQLSPRGTHTYIASPSENDPSMLDARWHSKTLSSRRDPPGLRIAETHAEAEDSPSLSRGSRFAAIMDKIAPFLSKVFGLLAFILFILGNILLFSPLPSTPLSCYHAAPLLWWGVMVVTGVGWFLLAQLLLVVVLVGLGSAVVVAILAKIGIEANTSLQARSSTVSRLSPLTLAELHALQYVCYIPSTSREHFPVENLPHPAIYLDDQKNTCGICQDTFVPPQYGKEQLAQWLIELKCGHVYHAKCIDEWLIKGSATCPFCQRSVRDVVDPSSAGGSQGSTLVNERRDSAFSTW